MPEEMKPPINDSTLRERIYPFTNVPFPYEWITANGGVRRLVKNIGLDQEQQRGEQGQPLKVGKKQ